MGCAVGCVRGVHTFSPGWMSTSADGFGSASQCPRHQFPEYSSWNSTEAPVRPGPLCCSGGVDSAIEFLGRVGYLVGHSLWVAPSAALPKPPILVFLIRGHVHAHGVPVACQSVSLANENGDDCVPVETLDIPNYEVVTDGDLTVLVNGASQPNPCSLRDQSWNLVIRRWHRACRNGVR